MNVELIERMFTQAWRGINKRKLLIAFFALALCGLITVFSRVLAFNSGKWVTLSLSFFPIFLSAGILFALGVLLIKMYVQEKAREAKSIFMIVGESWKTMLSIAYVTFPLFLVYLLFWLCLGVFFLMKSIPGVGNFMGVMLSFGPFILILASLILAFINILFLFFITPMISLSKQLDANLWHNFYARFKNHILLHIIFFVTVFTPIVLYLFF